MDRLLLTAMSANEQTCLITSEHLQLQRLDRRSLGECRRYLRKLYTIWCTRQSEAQSRLRLTSTIASPGQPDACCSITRAEGTAYIIPNSIIEYHITSPTHTLRVANLLASTEKPTSHSLCENKQTRSKTHKVREQPILQYSRLNVRLT